MAMPKSLFSGRAAPVVMARSRCPTRGTEVAMPKLYGPAWVSCRGAPQLPRNPRSHPQKYPAYSFLEAVLLHIAGRIAAKVLGRDTKTLGCRRRLEFRFCYAFALRIGGHFIAETLGCDSNKLSNVAALPFLAQHLKSFGMRLAPTSTTRAAAVCTATGRALDVPRTSVIWV